LSVWRKTIAVAVVGSMLLPGAVLAQMPDGAPPPRPQLRLRQPPPVPELRDPTLPNPAVRQAIEAAQGPLGGKPAPGEVQATPQMRLKARIIGTRTPPVAIVEINGSPYTVRRDTALVLGGASSGLQVRVIELTAEEVQLELLPAKKVYIMH